MLVAPLRGMAPTYPELHTEAGDARAHAGAPSAWAVLAVVGIGVFMCTLDTSIVNVSLPAIARHFGVPIGASFEWVVIAYLVVIAALLLTIGRLSDRIGRRPLWLAGLVIFTAGSALCGLAPSLGVLIGARVVQGVGGALLMAISPAMLTDAFPAAQRGRALGLNATIVALGVSAGPTLGGVLTEAASWRWIFYVNLPIGVAGVISSRLVLRPASAAPRRARFDVGGAIALGAALAALTAGLSVANAVGWGSPIVLGLLAASVITAAWFVVHERRHAAPLIERGLFRDPVFAWATVSLVLSFLAAFATSFLLPFYFEQLRGDAPARTGLLLTPFPIALAIVAPLSGQLADRIGTRGLAALGMAILCAGLVCLAFIDEHTATWGVIWRQLVAAVGMGMFQAPNNSAIMGAVASERKGVAAGMLATGRTMGQAISVAIAGAVFGALGGAAAGRGLLDRPHDPALSATFVHGFRAALLVCAAIAALGIASSLLRGGGRDGVPSRA
ncbi:MAG TPA: MFS transporter [Kofleriaceae bacterium]|nr:MFS transporter [Kofleriaceae bacterium]